MNKKVMRCVVLFAISLFIQACAKIEAPESAIRFENLRVILPPPVATSTAVYGEIKNTGKTDDVLEKITSNAGMIMLHQTRIQKGSAQMLHTGEFTLKAHHSLMLKPLSYHLMFMDVNHDVVKEGGSVQLTFIFKQAGKITVSAPVEKAP